MLAPDLTSAITAIRHVGETISTTPQTIPVHSHSVYLMAADPTWLKPQARLDPLRRGGDCIRVGLFGVSSAHAAHH
jgi:hypothetical protein